MKLKKLFHYFHLLFAIILMFTSNNIFAQQIFNVSPNGSNDHAVQINNVLDNMSPGDKINLTGNFVIRSTIFIPSGITWVLDGKITLGSNAKLTYAGYTQGSIQNDTYISNHQPTAITEKNWDTTGATNIDMSGGVYDGDQQRADYVNLNGRDRNDRVRLIQFIGVKNSYFHDMHITNASDDCFSISHYSENNEMRNMLADYAGEEPGPLSGNGFTDRGRNNKWFDCVAAFCTSDGWTPKCNDVDFIRCVARNNVGPGWGIFCRWGGSEKEGTTEKGKVLDNCKYIACEAYENEASGFSFNVSSSELKPRSGSINNNLVEGVSYDNDQSGVRYRLKMHSIEVQNNDHDMLCYGNRNWNSDKEVTGTAGGLGTEANHTDENQFPMLLNNITGSFVAFDNDGPKESGIDINLRQAENSNVTNYRPTTEGPVTHEDGPNSNMNTITEETFNCNNYNNLTTWAQREYYNRFCKPTGCNIPHVDNDISFTDTDRIYSWSTGPINISCLDDGAFISMNVEGLPNMEPSDYLKVYYRLDGNVTETTLIEENTGSFAIKQITIDGLKGQSVEIIVEAMNTAANETYNVTNITVDTSLSVNSSSWALNQVGNYPNPFSNQTTISYNLTQDANVSINVYNLTGQLVSTLVANENQNAGSQNVIWNANNVGNSLSSGVYIYTIKGISNGKTFTQNHKMVLLNNN